MLGSESPSAAGTRSSLSELNRIREHLALLRADTSSHHLERATDGRAHLSAEDFVESALERETRSRRFTQDLVSSTLAPSVAFRSESTRSIVPVVI